jgi:PAS domain S-box-containing protein
MPTLLLALGVAPPPGFVASTLSRLAEVSYHPFCILTTPDRQTALLTEATADHLGIVVAVGETYGFVPSQATCYQATVPPSMLPELAAWACSQLELLLQMRRHNDQIEAMRLEAVREAQDRQLLVREHASSRAAIQREVLERRQAEEAVREREERIRLLLDSTAEGIYGLDTMGCCTFCNSACLRLLGYTDEHQLLGKNMHDVLHHSHADGSPYAMANCPIFHAFRHGDRIHIDQEVLWRADGTCFPAEYWSYPVIDRGTVIGAVVTFVDISSRRLAETRLQESANWLTQILESCAVPIFVIDNAHRVTHWNRACAQLVGMPATDIIGTGNQWQPFYDEQRPVLADLIILGADHAEINRYYGNAGRKSTVIADAFEIVSFLPKLGTEGLWLHFTAAPLRDASGTVIGAIETLIDITDLKRAEAEVLSLNQDLEYRVQQRTAELQSALEHMEAFGYSMSHDLRTPLRAMAGYANIIAEEFSTTVPVPAQQYLARIADNAVRMGKLIDDLLQYAHIYRQPISRQPVNCREMIDQLLAEREPLLGGGRWEFRVSSLPACQAEPALLRMVFGNLLDNAIKFTQRQQHPRIEIGARRQNKQTVYYLRDNGIGFDMTYADKLFGMFQRLHLNEEYAGTGVGLAIVESIVRRHGGRVWAEGEVGAGATFFFTIGGQDAAPQPTAAPVGCSDCSMKG